MHTGIDNPIASPASALDKDHWEQRIANSLQAAGVPSSFRHMKLLAK